jgi:exosortase B
MTFAQLIQPAKSDAFKRLLWPGLLIFSILVSYVPTLLKLIDGPWKTEQEGHGPLIIAACVWLVWQLRARLRLAKISPAPIFGWIFLLFGLSVLFLARLQQGLVTFEMFSIIPVIVGCILITAGWSVLRVLLFPIVFLFFAIPMPDWIVEAATVPLKVFISNMVTRILYAAGYPVAQNGVMIMIGTYQLLVKDACSGMNSIFALSAIGVFYAYEFRRSKKFRSLVLLASIIPITIAANFIRVLALVLIAYYGGPDLLEGIVHDLTGISLFVVALLLLFLLDVVLGFCIAAFNRIHARAGRNRETETATA